METATGSSEIKPLPRPPWREVARRYGFAVLVVAVVFAVRWYLDPFLGSQAPLLTFVAAVLLAAWYGGLGPGLTATALSLLLGGYFFISPVGGLPLSDPSSLIHMVLFGGIGSMISVLSGHLRAARGRELSRLSELERSAAELRQAEAENRALAQHLERRVEERTAELAEANQALEAFSYSVSHDLRAPLRGMQGFAQALLEDYGDRLDGTGHEYANRIVAASARMESLINDLLAYSRLSRVQIEPQRVSLSSALAEARVQVESDLSRREAQILVQEPLPSVLAHRPTLVQALTNLLSNAVKFTPEGGLPEVRVWAENGGDRVRLSVEDNGIGIAPEHQARIFNVFERLHGMETYPGTGIGLAIVRKGMERMGGRVGVESAPGRGSRFWIELPAVEQP